MRQFREIELLAPARDLQTGIEAIRHGADAVYIGASRFGARAAAGNSVEDIRQLVLFARPYAVKVYVTLNTIIYDNELDDVRRLVGELEEIGVDALIVQDLALLSSKFLDEPSVTSAERKNNNSKLGLHASTQMDNRTAEKVAWLRDLGFEQVVLARELTLEEIRDIHERVPDVRLEVFVHGAICVSYNGQCYASQHCFGRSANRGECAQFCRMPFDLVDEEGHVLQKQKHLLSLRDMNRSEALETLLDAGVSSLKIEGRLKDVGYVKNVVAYYRQRLDEVFRRRPEYCRSSLGHETIAFTPNPAKSFNRLFTDYFLHGRTPNMANIHTPKSMGEPVGFAEIKDDGLRVKDEVELHNGDGLCFINDEGQLVGFRLNRVEGDKVLIQNSKNAPLFTLHGPRLFYRNHDQQFEQQLSKPTATRKVGVRWLLKETDGGFLLRLTREDGVGTEHVFPYPHELARSPQREPIIRQLSRLGDTPYETVDVDIDMSQDWFIPGSVLAEWRRCLSEELSVKKEELKVLQSAHIRSAENPFSFQSSLNYQFNVANHVARQFYLDHGAKLVEWAMEVEKPKVTGGRGLLLMTCRYCIRHELGMCLKKNGGRRTECGGQNALFLRLTDGRRFRLHFDCQNCQMLVYAE